MLLPPQTSEPVDEDYAHARRRAFLDAIMDRLRRHHQDLLPLAEVRARVGVHGQHDRGIQLVPLANIVGSQGRYLDFDRSFLPRTSQTAQRWKHVDRARRENVELPPVELYKLSDVYFVVDGNHRVSVARHAGQVDIQAHVTELDIDVPLMAWKSCPGAELSAAGLLAASTCMPGAVTSGLMMSPAAPFGPREENSVMLGALGLGAAVPPVMDAVAPVPAAI